MRPSPSCTNDGRCTLLRAVNWRGCPFELGGDLTEGGTCFKYLLAGCSTDCRLPNGSKETRAGLGFPITGMGVASAGPCCTEASNPESEPDSRRRAFSRLSPETSTTCPFPAVWKDTREGRVAMSLCHVVVLSSEFRGKPVDEDFSDSETDDFVARRVLDRNLS